MAPRLALFHENVVGFPVDGDTRLGLAVSQSRDGKRENFGREMRVSVKVVGSGVQHEAVFEVSLVTKAANNKNSKFINLGSGTTLAGSKSSKHVNLRGGDNRLPHGLNTVKVRFNVNAFNGEQVVMLLQNTDAAENVYPFLVEGTGGMVIAAFAHLRKFKPFVIFNIVHLSTMGRPVLIFSSSGDYHEGVRKGTDGMSVSRETHVCFLFKFTNRSSRVIELPTLVQG